MIAALVNAGTMLGEPSWIEQGGRAFDFIARRHDQGRPARPFLARGPAAFSGACLRLRHHDPRRAGAATRRPAQRPLSRAGAGLAAGVRRPLRQSGQRRLFPHRRRRRGPGGAPGLDQRRRHAQPERDRRAKSGPARGARPATTNGARRPTGCSTACWPARPTTCFACRAAQRARPAAASRPRSWSPGPDHARFAAAALKLPYPQPDRAARAVGRGAAGRPSGAGQNRGRRRRARPSSASARRCSLPVTDPDKIAEVIAAMRPAPPAG